MQKNKKGCDLTSCMLCKGCLKEWLPAIDAHRQTFRYKKGEQLFTEGDKVAGIYFIYSGTVKVHKKWEEGKELIVRIAHSGDIVGHRGLGKDNYYPVSGTALEPTDACFIDINFFLSTLRVNHDFVIGLMMFFAGELKESERNMRNLAHMPVKGRVAQCILTLQNKFGADNQGWIKIILSRQDLASFAGATYETVFRIMNELVQAGVIRTEGKKIAINDRQTLESFVQ
jgi:CRP-like cAMP-binding protein